MGERPFYRGDAISHRGAEAFFIHQVKTGWANGSLPGNVRPLGVGFTLRVATDEFCTEVVFADDPVWTRYPIAAKLEPGDVPRDVGLRLYSALLKLVGEREGVSHYEMLGRALERV